MYWFSWTLQGNHLKKGHLLKCDQQELNSGGLIAKPVILIFLRDCDLIIIGKAFKSILSFALG